jgi:DNA-binding response OmpR family regulator
MINKKILIVDDDRDFLVALQVRLEGHGYHVVSAVDVLGALDAVETETPDLIILDIRLFVGNGILLLRRLKSTDSFANVPVIILTAQQPGFLREEAFKHGAVAYFQKPADNEKLLSAMRNALHEPSGIGR